MMIPPDADCQTDCGIEINSEDALRISVNIMMLPANERVTMSGLSRLLLVAELPIMTGSTGKTHGAKIVSIPAKNETPSKNRFIGAIKKL